MKFPTEIKIPATKLATLLAVTSWYEMMPKEEGGFYAGDAFHMNMNEFQMSFVPDLDVFNDGVFVSHFELVDGVLYVALDQDEEMREGDELNTSDPYVYVPFVAE